MSAPGVRRVVRIAGAALACLAVTLHASEARAQGAESLYQTHCASCHGVDRLGAMGPALLPENLERLKRGAAEQVIAQGRAATQMPAFAENLDPAHIKSLAG